LKKIRSSSAFKEPGRIKLFTIREKDMRGIILDNFIANYLVNASVDSKYVLVKWLGLTFVMLTALLIYGIERTYYRAANWLKTSGSKNLLPADGKLKLADME
jgi:hypothetical protein